MANPYANKEYVYDVFFNCRDDEKRVKKLHFSKEDARKYIINTIKEKQRKLKKDLITVLNKTN